MTRLYWGDPDDAFNKWDADQEAYEKKCPICDWCDEPITDETYLQRIDHKGLKIRYHEDCAHEWFDDNFSTLYTDDYIGESE